MAPKNQGKKGLKPSDNLKQQKLKLVTTKERENKVNSGIIESTDEDSEQRQTPSPQSTLFRSSQESRTRRKHLVFSPSYIDVTMSTPELTKKLTTMCSELRDMKQEDCPEVLREMVPFCVHLAGEDFRSHPDKDVQLLVACCLADILRIFAPEAPFTEQEEVKALFLFFGSQLSGLANANSPRFKRYFYLLENLTFVEAFLMCLDLEDEDSQDVFINLFEVLFTAFSSNNGKKVLHTMSLLLSPILEKSPGISFELLDVILRNILDKKKPAYQLAKHVLVMTLDHIEGCIGDFLSGIARGNVPEVNATYCVNHLYDLVYRLNQIDPSLGSACLNKLEYKLMSPNKEDRISMVNLIGRIYSSEKYTESVVHSALWNGFCARFTDISPEVRRLCVHHCLAFMLNHPETRSGVAKALSSRQHDSHEAVRLEVVKVISGAATNGAFDFIPKSNELMECLRERCYDKKINVRELAHEGLADIYKKYLDDKIEDGPPNWIHNRILQGYYLASQSDKILVERLFHTSIVPFDAETTKEKVNQLIFVYSTLDNTGRHALNLLLKEINRNRKLLTEMKSIVTRQVSNDEKLELKRKLINYMSKLLPNPFNGREPISKFMKDMEENKKILENVEMITNPASDCKTVLSNMAQVLKQLGPEVKTNSYYSSMKTILERSASVLIDVDVIQEIIRLLTYLLKTHTSDDSEEDEEFPPPKFLLSKDVLVEKTCLLLEKLVEHFPGLFSNSKILDSLGRFLEDDSLGRYSSSTLLSVLAKFGQAIGPVMKLYPTAITSLEKICLHAIDTGSSRQVKMAVRCFSANVSSPKEKDEMFTSVLRTIKEHLKTSCVNLSAVVALSEIARVTPKVNPDLLKQIMVHYVIKKILLSPTRTSRDASMNKNASWVEQGSLPEVTQCMLSAMKAIAHWLIGLPNATEQVKKTFQLLTFFIQTGGNKDEDKDKSQFLYSRSEMAWISLTAGKAILKMLHYKEIVTVFAAQHLASIATLMNYDVLEVRSCFASKLHHQLSKNFPYGSLPSEMLGLYVLGGFESDKTQKQTIKQFMLRDIKVRRSFIARMRMEAPDRLQSQLPFLMPEYMVAFAIVVLTNNPHFTNPDDVEEIKDLKRCFRDLLDAVVIKDCNVTFLTKIVQLCKNRRNGYDPDNETFNRKMYVLCDIVHEILFFKSGSLFEDTTETPRLSMHFFCKATQSNWHNSQIYLKEDNPANSYPRTRGRKRLLTNTSCET